MPNEDHLSAPLSPRAQALGLSLEDTYFDHDTQMREPKIANSDENWDNGTLGCDERYVRVVKRAVEVPSRPN